MNPEKKDETNSNNRVFNAATLPIE